MAEPAGAAPTPAWVLYGGTFLNRFGSSVITFLVLYLRRRGYSPAAAGLAVSAYGAGGLASAAVGDLLADRLGRRASIALSMFRSAGAALALSQARGLIAITVLTAAFGLASELYRPASSALVADLVPAGERVPAFAAYRLAINAGFPVGPVVGGLLAERSFFWLFVGDAATSAAFGVVALLALPEGVRTSRREERRGESVRAIAADRTFLLFLLASTAIGFVYFQSQATFALHVRRTGCRRRSMACSSR